MLEGISKELSRHPEIFFAYAYGSFLEDGPFWDLDLAVYLHPKQVGVESFRYQDALATDIGRQFKLSFPLDIRILNGTPVSFRYRVFRGRLLFEREPAVRIELVVRTLTRYFDLAPFLHHFLKDAYGCAT